MLALWIQASSNVVSRAPPPSFKKDIAKIKPTLALDIANWLKKHGKTVHPPLSARSRRQLKECFELMDADGSGAIDADELYSAFQLLGLQMKRGEVVALLEEVDKDGSGEVDYCEFLQIMTTTLGRNAEEKHSSDENDTQLPFSLMATAYRRKRLMEGLVSRDKAIQQQLVRMAAQMEEDDTKNGSKPGSASEASSTSFTLRGDSLSPVALIPRRFREPTGTTQKLLPPLSTLPKNPDAVNEVWKRLDEMGAGASTASRRQGASLVAARKQGTQSSLSQPRQKLFNRRNLTVRLPALDAMRCRSVSPTACTTQSKPAKLPPLTISQLSFDPAGQRRVAKTQNEDLSRYKRLSPLPFDVRQNHLQHQQLFRHSALLFAN